MPSLCASLVMLGRYGTTCEPIWSVIRVVLYPAFAALAMRSLYFVSFLSPAASNDVSKQRASSVSGRCPIGQALLDRLSLTRSILMRSTCHAINSHKINSHKINSIFYVKKKIKHILNLKSSLIYFMANRKSLRLYCP